MSIPSDAVIVTADGASVQLQPEGLSALTIGGGREVQLSADVAQPFVDPAVAAAGVPAGDDAARVLAALQAGEDPFAVLDPTAAVLGGAGGDDGGSSFTRIAAVLETTIPLGLEYPRPSLPTPENLTLGGASATDDDAAVPGPAPTLQLTINEDNTVTFQFSQVPVGFDLDDIEGFNGELANLVQDPNDPTLWTADLTPNEGFEGDIVVSVPDGSYTNEAGVPGTGDNDNTNVVLPQPEPVEPEEPVEELPVDEEEPGDEEEPEVPVTPPAPTASIEGASHEVHEADTNTHTVEHTVLVTASDGIATIYIGGEPFTVEQLLDAANSTLSVNTDEGTVHILSYVPANAAGTRADLTYTYTLNGPQQHGAEGTPTADSLVDTIMLAVEGATSSSAISQISVTIVDDAPEVSIIEELDVGAGQTFIIEKDDKDSFAHGFGADDGEGKTFTVTVNDGAATAFKFFEGKATLEAEYGTLTINEDGSYSYTANSTDPDNEYTEDGQRDTFVFHIEDADGDTDTATLNVYVGPALQPNELSPVTVNESGLREPVEGEGPSTDHTAEIVIPERYKVSGDPRVSSTDGAEEAYGTVALVGEQWVYTLKNTFEHNAPGNRGSKFKRGADEVTLILEDEHGNTFEMTMKVNIVDDAPTAETDDGGAVVEGAVDDDAVLEGNVLDNDDFGADGFQGEDKSVEWLGDLNGTAEDLANEYGALKLDTDGSWSFTLDHDKSATKALTEGEIKTVQLSYRITDADGDTSISTLTFKIQGVDTAPEVKVEGAAAIVYEAGLIPDSTKTTSHTGKLKISDPDTDSVNLAVALIQPETGILKSGDEEIEWKWASTETEGKMLIGFVPGEAGGSDTDIIKVEIGNVVPATGEDGQPVAGEHQVDYTVTLLGPVDHPAGNASNPLTFNLPLSVTDGTTTLPNINIAVTVKDDVPVAEDSAVSSAARGEGLENGALAYTEGKLGYDFGADKAAVSKALVLLKDTLSSDLEVVGGAKVAHAISVTGLEISGMAGGEPVYKLVLDPASGEWKFYQFKPLDKAGVLDFQFQVSDADQDFDTGNFSINLVPANVTTLTLASTEKVTEGTDEFFTVTANVGSPVVDGPLTVKFEARDEHGEPVTFVDGDGQPITTITIDNGQTSGEISIPVRADDVYRQGEEKYTFTVDETVGGAYEKLDFSDAASTTLVAEDQDNIHVEVGSIITQTSTIDIGNVKSSDQGFKVTAYGLDGEGSSVATYEDSLRNGFGVAGKVQGGAHDAELGYVDGKSESLEIEFLAGPIYQLQVAFAWRHPGESAKVEFWNGSDYLGHAIVSGGSWNANQQVTTVKYYDSTDKVVYTDSNVWGGSDNIDPGYIFKPGSTAGGVIENQLFTKAIFTAVGAGSDYLINRIDYKEVVTGWDSTNLNEKFDAVFNVQTSHEPDPAVYQADAVYVNLKVGSETIQVMLDANGKGDFQREQMTYTQFTEMKKALEVSEIVGGNFEGWEQTVILIETINVSAPAQTGAEKLTAMMSFDAENADGDILIPGESAMTVSQARVVVEGLPSENQAPAVSTGQADGKESSDL